MKTRQRICNLLSAIAASATALLSVQCSDAQTARFTGRIADYSGSPVYTMDALALTGETTPVAVNPDGTFSLEIDATQPGAYYIVIESPKSGFKFYAEKGLEADFQINFKDSVLMGYHFTAADVTYNGPHRDCFDFLQRVSYFDAQNKVLQAAQGNNWPFKLFRSTLREEVDALEAQFRQIETPAFRQMMLDDYEAKFLTSLFWYVELNDTPDDDFTAFANSIDRNSPDRLILAQLYLTAYKKFYMPPTDQPQVDIYALLPTVYTNPEVLAAIADEEVTSALADSPADPDAIFQAYTALRGTDNIPPSVSQAYTLCKQTMAGRQAPDFELLDPAGHSVRLSDLRGKLLYIDVWATWCGPCKIEAPLFAALYEQYKDDARIAFVSISVDTDQAAWQKMIKDEGYAWQQYIAPGAFQSALCTQYSINGIPRFLLIGPDGAIVNADAPRPSAEGITDYLNSLLNPQ